MAGESLPRVDINIVDSRTAGGAQGFIALAAARAAASGKVLAELTRVAEEMIPRVHMIAVLDTLQYLAKAGRIPRVAAWGGGILKINPILTFSSDGIKLLENARTKPKAVGRLIELMEERIGRKPVHVNVMHADVPDELRLPPRQAHHGLDLLRRVVGHVPVLERPLVCPVDDGRLHEHRGPVLCCQVW